MAISVPEQGRLRHPISYFRTELYATPAYRSDTPWCIRAVSEGIRLTSISDYQHYKQDISSDLDGTPFHSGDFRSFGHLDSVNQEIRLSGTSSSLEWILGANYTHVSVVDNSLSMIGDVSVNQVDPDLPRFNAFGIISTTKLNNYAIFGNIEYKIAHHISLLGGARFTQSNRSFNGCSTAPNSSTADQFEALQSIIKGSSIPIELGGCLTFDANFNPTLFKSKLNENNLSIRAGINYKSAGDTLLYATYNRGYKAGADSDVIARSVPI